jgi:hypothetical protein
MSCGGTTDCTCGCCAGTSVQTPAGESNLPGLSSIAYRTGTWATFKQSMLARLSSADYPALSPLKTRDDDDFSIAFLDAAAVVMDILTFYQERLANESYLRTAVQLRSLTELSRLIGYQPAPGVSSSVYLAFTLKAATGQPANPGTPAISIPAGTQVQSVPAQGQTAQTFETSAAITAKPDWNALPVQTGNPWAPAVGDTSLYLSGAATQLNPGDSILLVGDERIKSSSSTRWEVRPLTAVTVDAVNDRTLVQWNDALITPSTKNAKVYALRQRAALFGYNALNPLMLAAATITILHHNHLLNAARTEWKFLVEAPDGNTLADDSLVDLDAIYSKLTGGGWLVLTEPAKNIAGAYSAPSSLYAIQAVTSVSRSSFSMSAKLSRLLVDTAAGLKHYYRGTRSASALTQSEQLPAAETPLLFPLYGTCLDLESVRPDLAGTRIVSVTGKSQKLSVNTGVSLNFHPDDGSKALTLKPGDIVTLTDPTPLPLDKNGSTPGWDPGSSTVSTRLTLLVMDPNGRPGSVKARLTDFTLALASKTDPVIQECALVASVSTIGTPPHTRIVLQSDLLNCYDRTMTTVNCNVGLATAGASTAEIMGNGAAATPNQDFALKQSPLTYIQAPTSTGRQSTLQVSANGVKWTEIPTLYEQPATAQVFSTLNQSNGTTDVLFGDGIEGATLPTGQNNIQATYRTGSGSAGNVSPASITTLIDRPLGVSGVVNPQAATGGQDPQSIDDIRANAPQSVLTLGRVVSITDYQTYAATFAGIAKANALWIPSGSGRGIFLTVAAAGGSALPPGNPTLANVVTSLQSYGNPLVPIYAASFLETLFSLSADIKYDPAYSQPAVESAILAALTANYSFAARTFGQGVSADEIAAGMQAIPGVIAVNVRHLRVVATSAGGDLASIGGSYSVSAYNNWITQQVTLTRPHGGHARICPYLPVAGLTGLPQPAEILVLDPDPKKVVLGVMA